MAGELGSPSPGYNCGSPCEKNPRTALMSVLSKLFVLAVTSQISDYLSTNELLPATLFPFRPGHLTTTAVLRVLSDILTAVDRGDFAALVLLDLSTAFNTVDLTILLERLRRTFGFCGIGLEWMASYLSRSTECVLHYNEVIMRCTTRFRFGACSYFIHR